MHSLHLRPPVYFIIRLSRLGWTQDEIGKMVGMSRGRITQITNNANFGNIGNLLVQGDDMDLSRVKSPSSQRKQKRLLGGKGIRKLAYNF